MAAGANAAATAGIVWSGGRPDGVTVQVSNDGSYAVLLDGEIW
eukprot:COSAG01_NODE_45069_length_412_cov_82.571885_1_plen_42_part_10